MGAGASTDNSPRPGAGQGGAANRQVSAVSASFSANPFEGDNPFSQSQDAKGNGNSNTSGLSERKLKKMALGMPGYKDVQRDYDETLADLGRFNTTKTDDWVAPIGGEGSAPVKQERLYDGYAYGKSAKGPSPIEAQVDVRSIQRQRQQQAVSSGVSSAMATSGPPRGNKPQPPRRPGPAPPRPAGPMSHPSIQPKVGGGATQDPRNLEIMAPTYLAPPIAAMQGAPPTRLLSPVNGSSSSNSNKQGSAATVTAGGIRQSWDSANSKESGDAGVGLLAGADAIMNSTNVARKQRQSDPSRVAAAAAAAEAGNKSAMAANQGVSSRNNSTTTTPVKTPIKSATSSAAKKAITSAKVRKNESDSDDSVGSADEGGLYEWTAYDTSADYKQSGNSSAAGDALATVQSNSSYSTDMGTGTCLGSKPNTPGISNSNPNTPHITPLKIKAPTQPPPGHASSTAAAETPTTPHQGLPIRPFPKGGNDEIEDMYASFGPNDEPPMSPKKPTIIPLLNIGDSGSGGGGISSSSSASGNSSTAGGGGGSTNHSMASNSKSHMSIPSLTPSASPGPPASSGPNFILRKSNGEKPAPPLTISPMKSLSGGTASGGNQSQRMQPRTGGAPPKPGANKAYEVKETTEVNRNKAQLPQAFSHAKPTTGDWLKKRYIVNNYILLDILGSGSYGEVRLCKERTTDHLYAVKIFSKDMLRKKKGGSTETYFEDVKREIAVMKKLLHPNVLRLFEVLDDPNVNKMYLILEYMKKGDLINILQRNNPHANSDDAMLTGGFTPLSDLELWNIFRQVAAGIRYLHFQNIVHGDIKPQNLLVGEDGVVKIADFGIAKMLHASGQKLVDSSGTPAFMSPELFDTGGSFSGQLADIWAIGATMFMLRFGAPPFIAKNIVVLSNKIQNDPLIFPEGPLEEKLRDLLENMLVKNPNNRFTLQQVIMHPWMRVQPAPPVVHQPGKTGTGVNESALEKGRVPPAVSSGSHFAPPSSYEKDEAAAMKGPSISSSLNKEDIYKSIGFNNSKPKGGVSGNGAIEEEQDEDVDGTVADNDLMATKWGADMFEMVDDNVDSGSEDDDTMNESTDTRTQSLKNSSQKSMTGTGATDSGMATFGERSEMSHEEEELRANRFKKSSKNRRSNESMDTGSVLADNTASAQNSSVNVTETLRVSSKSRTTSNSSPGQIRNGVGGSRGRAGDDEEEDDLEASTEKLTMSEFGAMMDTLALQPKSKNMSAAVPLNIEVKSTSFSVQLRNPLNGVGAAFHSEQGQRPDQEDRCVLLPDVSAMRALQGNEKVTPAMRETLSKFSIAAVFDGHSGWQCSQYLSQHLIPALTLHEKFLDKQPDTALLESFKLIDAKVGGLLRKEECNAGSTAIVAVYDGRRHIFTVANVGDSMCVLSRSGRAVKMHRVHRVITDMQECTAECERVASTGSKIVNNRVDGVLAISRAFGDVAFKNGPKGPGPVISVPDICTEVITPMTEFGIIASDGLWDVMEPQLAVNFVRKLLSKKNNLQEAAAELVREALAKGSVDNVTVLIVSFHMAPSKTETGESDRDRDGGKEDEK